MKYLKMAIFSLLFLSGFYLFGQKSTNLQLAFRVGSDNRVGNPGLNMGIGLTRSFNPYLGIYGRLNMYQTLDKSNPWYMDKTDRGVVNR